MYFNARTPQSIDRIDQCVEPHEVDSARLPPDWTGVIALLARCCSLCDDDETEPPSSVAIEL